jgi:hypothetical protein
LNLHEPVRFDIALSGSQRLRAATVAVYSVAAVLMLALLPSLWGIALAVLVFCYGWQFARRRFSENSVYRIQALRLADGGWSVQRNGQWCGAKLLSPVFCHHHLAVLRFKSTGQWLPVTAVITCGNVGGDAFRQLRCLARHLPVQQLWAPSP